MTDPHRPAKPPRPFATMRRALRRREVLLVGSGLVLAATLPALATEVLEDISALQPGQFTWHPDRQPFGPLAVVVSLDQQRVHVYRNGVRIAVSTCSTGKKGHETPTGVFVILQKDKHHRSSTYNGAPMPNMNRLTWDGIALHAGNLPGYPASHGCVRLPMEFSARLFELTHLGTPVIIASSQHDPWALTHPGPVLSGYAAEQMADAVAGQTGKMHPADWVRSDSDAITTVVLSTREGRALVLENDVQVDAGTVTLPGDPAVGQHVFVLQSAEQGKGFTWNAISHHDEGKAAAQRDLLNELVFERDFADRLVKRVHSGTVMIVMDTPLTPDTRSGKDFVILDSEA